MGDCFDISLINANELPQLFVSAVNGSKSSGRIFSAIYDNVSILLDKKNIANFFISSVKKLHQILALTSLPNHGINSIYLHNIGANQKDWRKGSDLERYFAYQSLQNQLFDYISLLVYPFYASGSYRGKVLKMLEKDFKKLSSISTNENHINYHYKVDTCIDKYCPQLETNYKSFFYSDALKKEIQSGKVNAFYFGYDNLIMENIIIFINEEEVIEIGKRIKLQMVGLSNIIPLSSNKELKYYQDFLSFLSKKYNFSSLERRKEILGLVMSFFDSKGFKNLIESSLKSLVIIKSFNEIMQEKLQVAPKNIDEWIYNIDRDFSFEIKSNREHPQEQQKLLKFYQFIVNKDNLRDKEIIVSYLFFGIMKSLRINIENLKFSI